MINRKTYYHSIFYFHGNVNTTTSGERHKNTRRTLESKEDVIVLSDKENYVSNLNWPFHSSVKVERGKKIAGVPWRENSTRTPYFFSMTQFVLYFSRHVNNNVQLMHHCVDNISLTQRHQDE